MPWQSRQPARTTAGSNRAREARYAVTAPGSCGRGRSSFSFVKLLTVRQLGYKRSRSLAQLLILLVIIFLGVAFRGDTIEAVLKPLVAEARRRRSVYGQRSTHGPLASLSFDLNQDRSPAVIEETRPKPPSRQPTDPDQRESATTAAPTPSPRVVSRIDSTTQRPAAPSTTRHRRQPSLLIPTFRSLSTDHSAIQGQLTTKSASPGSDGVTSPRPRVSLSPPRSSTGVPFRRLARTAHLHTIEADRLKSQVRQDPAKEDHHYYDEDSGSTPRPPFETGSMQSAPMSHIPLSPSTNGDRLSPRSPSNHVFPDIGTSTRDEEVEDWGTDVDGTEGSSSASEVDGGCLSNDGQARR